MESGFGYCLVQISNIYCDIIAEELVSYCIFFLDINALFINGNLCLFYDESSVILWVQVIFFYYLSVLLLYLSLSSLFLGSEIIIIIIFFFSLCVFVELCYLRKGLTSVLNFIIFSIATHFKTMYCILQIVCIFWVPVQISIFLSF